MRVYHLAILLPLCACAGQNTVASYSLQPDRAHSVLRFHRESTLMAVGVPARLRINGKEVASLGSGDKYEHLVPKGEVNIAVDNPTDFGTYRISQRIDPNRFYDIEISPRAAPILLGGVLGAVGSGAEAGLSSEKSGTFSMEVK